MGCHIHEILSPMIDYAIRIITAVSILGNKELKTVVTVNPQKFLAVGQNRQYHLVQLEEHNMIHIITKKIGILG